MPSGTDRIAHVVQAIEKRHEIVAIGGKILGRGLLKGNAVADPRFLRERRRAVERGPVVFWKSSRGRIVV
jgi:hypothetical protein